MISSKGWGSRTSLFCSVRHSPRNRGVRCFLSEKMQELSTTTSDGEVEKDERPRRIGLFRGGMSYGTLAAIAVTCAAIGLGSLGLEVLVMFITEQGPIGHMIGLPIPFVSTPLGAGALVISGLLVVTRPRVSLLPVLSTLAYMAAMVGLWMNL